MGGKRERWDSNIVSASSMSLLWSPFASRMPLCAVEERIVPKGEDLSWAGRWRSSTFLSWRVYVDR